MNIYYFIIFVYIFKIILPTVLIKLSEKIIENNFKFILKVTNVDM